MWVGDTLCNLFLGSSSYHFDKPFWNLSLLKYGLPAIESASIGCLWKYNRRRLQSVTIQIGGARRLLRTILPPEENDFLIT